jgi:hypothetical protein
VNQTRSQRLALRDFDHARRQAFWRDLWGRLTGNKRQLLPFDPSRLSLHIEGQRYRGCQVVPLDSIVGSEGRHRDFDGAFYPRHSRTQDRWLRIDQAHYEQVALPPVQLLKVGELYFVRDGHHRASAARARQQGFVDAEVIEFEVSHPGERLELIFTNKPSRGLFPFPDDIRADHIRGKSAQRKQGGYPWIDHP